MAGEPHPKQTKHPHKTKKNKETKPDKSKKPFKHHGKKQTKKKLKKLNYAWETLPWSIPNPRAGLVRGRFSTHSFVFLVFVFCGFCHGFWKVWICLVWFVCLFFFLFFLCVVWKTQMSLFMLPLGPMAGRTRFSPSGQTGRPQQKSNYDLFNRNNFNIRYWSWNYRGCWHQNVVACECCGLWICGLWILVWFVCFICFVADMRIVIDLRIHAYIFIFKFLSTYVLHIST